MGGDPNVPFGTDATRWNAVHFLDLAEFTAGVAIAYDWMYDGWTDAQRTTIRNAIVTNGLDFCQASLSGASSAGAFSWWTGVNGQRSLQPFHSSSHELTQKNLSLRQLELRLQLRLHPRSARHPGRGHLWPGCCRPRSLGHQRQGQLRPCCPRRRYLEVCAFPCRLSFSSADRPLPSLPTHLFVVLLCSETPNYWYFGTTGFAEMTSSLITATGTDQGMLAANANFNLTASTTCMSLE